jgi:hypothetical protein
MLVAMSNSLDRQFDETSIASSVAASPIRQSTSRPIFRFNQGVFQKRIPFYLFFRWRFDRVIVRVCDQLVKTIKR